MAQLRPVLHLQVGEGKGQVDEIVEHFNISAGNPAVCMTQVNLVQAASRVGDNCSRQFASLEQAQGVHPHILYTSGRKSELMHSSQHCPRLACLCQGT